MSSKIARKGKNNHTFMCPIKIPLVKATQDNQIYFVFQPKPFNHERSVLKQKLALKETVRRCEGKVVEARK